MQCKTAKDDIVDGEGEERAAGRNRREIRHRQRGNDSVRGVSVVQIKRVDQDGGLVDNPEVQDR